MKKKFLISILAVLCAIACTFGLAACDNTQAPTHTHNYQWVNNGDGTHKQHCANTDCNEPDINDGNHIWGANDKCDKCGAAKPADGHMHDYQWVDNGNGTHKQHCANTDCNEPNINIGNHTWGANGKCEQCNAVKPSAEHTHDYKWVNNWDGTHKQVCRNEGCDEPEINAGEHTYAESNLGSRCDKCGDSAAPEGHTHDYQWKDDGGTGTHSLFCQADGCNYINPGASREEHTWGTNGVCDKCRAVNQQLHTHNWSTEYYCRDTDHIQICDSCNYVKNSDHNFVNNVCTLCEHKETTSSMKFNFTLNDDGKSYSVKLAKSWGGKYDENLTNVVIPCTRLGKPVTVIEAEGFKDNPYITSVEISGCCRVNNEPVYISIENGAFSGCTKLKSVVIPQTVTDVGFGAFEGCAAMTDITLPFVGRKGAEIDNYDEANFGYIFGAPSFRGSSSYVPSTLKNIKVTGGTFIAPHALSGCSGTTDITLPNGITTIGERAFPSSLVSVNIPSTVTAIGERAFMGCKITSIELSEAMQTIEASLFENCSELTEITIPNGVKSIGNNAFKGCSKITEIHIGDGVNSIGDNAFYWCLKLKSITVGENNAAYASQDGILYNKAKTSCILIPSDVGGKITVPNGITEISFSKPNITEVKLPDSIVSFSFDGCAGLTKVNIPDTVTIIGDNAFKNCTSLANVSIPSGVTKIGANAFNGCWSLDDINIPNTVTSIGAGAFHFTAWYDKKSDGNVYVNKFFYGYKGVSESTMFMLEQDTKGIADGAFQNYPELVFLTIPDSVIYISSNTFIGCARLAVIHYGGTKAQWESLMQNSDIPLFSLLPALSRIDCFDGDIEKSQN